jgi:hypothetical protein
LANRNLMYRGIAACAMLGIVTGLAGFFYTRFGTRGMGYVMFLLVPVAAGFLIGLLAKDGWAVAASGITAVAAILALLIAAGQEGFLCALMGSPLLVVATAYGAVLGFGVRMMIPQSKGQNSTTMGMLVLAMPVLVFAGKQVEKPLLDRARIDTVTNTIWVSDTIHSTWADIQSIDSIHASRPWLMHVGLPVPQRCTLQGARVGARRICYFDKGYIEETVTEWNPPYSMGLRIDRTHMPGRHWLGFETAAYRLEPEGEGTRLTRTTVISSHLYPAWYWRPLERWGVSSEHKYILEDVANRGRESVTAPAGAKK